MRRSSMMVIRAGLLTGALAGALLGTAAAGANAGTKPRVLRAPTVVGYPNFGHRLTASGARFSSSTPITRTYQWYVCGGGGCGAIPGATHSSFTVGATELGGTIAVGVTATNSAGHVTAVSAQTPEIAAIDVSSLAAWVRPTLRSHGSDGTLAAILANGGYSTIVHTGETGRLDVVWSQADASGGAGATVATASTHTRTGGSSVVTLQLTSTGAALLRSHSSIQIHSEAAFNYKLGKKGHRYRAGALFTLR